MTIYTNEHLTDLLNEQYELVRKLKDQLEIAEAVLSVQVTESAMRYFDDKKQKTKKRGCMSILNNGIRAWWIQKSESCNISNKVEFCDFKPTVHDRGYEWIRVISLDDFHKQVNINITRWVEVCQQLQEKQKLLDEAEAVVKNLYAATECELKLKKEFLSKLNKSEGI